MADALDLAADVLGETAESAGDGNGVVFIPTEATDEGLWVCPYLTDSGEVCGRSFDSLPKYSGHTQSMHGYAASGKKTMTASERSKLGWAKKRGTVQADEAPSRTTKPKAEQQAAKKATGAQGASAITDSNRAGTYAQSLATIGLLGHLAAGRYFDDYDLDVWTRGAVPLGNALDACGETNKGLRQACDLLLAGGGGGAYVQLIIAAAMIGVPIAAHHGFLPAQTGERFAAMAGVMATMTVVPPAPEEADVPAASANGAGTPPTAHSPDVSTWTLQDWMIVLNQMPVNIATDLSQAMMQGQGPTVVTIPTMPGTEPMDIPQEEHRGSVGADTNTVEPNGTADEGQPVPEPA